MANPFVGLELRVPRLNVADAARVARAAFGIAGVARELGSYQDQNFRIDAPGGRYVLKVANPAFAVAELDLQNRAMACAAQALPGLVPVALEGADGGDVVRADVGGEPYQVRLLAYLEGEPLRSWGHLAPAVLRDVGRLAGRVAAALAPFEHPAAGRVLQWDVRRAADVVAAYAGHVPDPERRAVAERSVEEAAATLAALDPGLRRQAVHGDATDWNVLAWRDEAGRPAPCGLIDFGDVTRSWLAAEIAVLAATAGARSSERALQDVVELVRGFHAAMPLLEEEVAALPALMLARAALSAVSGEQQAALDPDNAYATNDVEEGWERLATIRSVPPPLAGAALREACGWPAVRSRGPLLSARAGPVVEGLEGRTAVTVDLSVRTDALRFGAWCDPTAIAAAVDEAAAATPGGLAVGRHGEARLVHDAGPREAEPATVHLGTDLFLAEGTTVLAPLAGRLVHREPRGLALAVEDGLTLRLAGLVPMGSEGAEIRRGEPLGRVAPRAAADRLPPHLHVQLAVEPLGSAPPGLAPASLAGAWLALCPDPSPLVGLDGAAPPPAPAAALTQRRRYVASPQRLYYGAAPPEIERGWRQWLYDAHGRPYLDLINNVAIVGHSHPRVEEAATRQLRLLNTNSRFLYDAMGRFAERLSGLLPAPLEVVFLVNSGSEANDLALRLAREGTGREDVLCFDRAYHGWTAATIATEKARPGGGFVHPLPLPADPAASARSLRSAAELVAARPPAAFIGEALLGNEGGIVLPEGHLQEVYRLVRAAGGLCIADEVQVGYGRLGEHFWAFAQQGVVPDIVTIAKATGNGHPVAAVITTRALADAFDARDDLFASVGGTAVSCEVALAVLDVLEEEGLQDNARAVGDHLAGRLAPLVEHHPLVEAQHGMGLYRGLQLRSGPEALAVCERMLELGIVVQPTGSRGNVLKLKPPLCVTRDDADRFAATLAHVLAAGW